MVSRELGTGEVVFEYRFRKGQKWEDAWDVQITGEETLPVIPSEDDPSGIDALYFDGRQSYLRLTSRARITLQPVAQYTLIARLAQLSHYGDLRSSLIQETEPDRYTSLAYVKAEAYSPEVQEHAIVFWAPGEEKPVRLELCAGGSNEVLFESVRLVRNDPPMSTYTTGMCLRPVTFWGDTFFRSGRLIEAEDCLADIGVITDRDEGDDALWVLLHFDLPSTPKAPMTTNPWFFSEFSVLKSDLLSRDEGGRCPPLHMHVRSLLPGRYQAYLSDPFRDAAVSFDGQTYQRVEGGKGEINLELVDVGPDGWHLWIDHRYRTQDNPGPIYVDYVRFLPVYDPEGHYEQPQSPPVHSEVPTVNDIPIRLTGSAGIARTEEWVWTGVPFAPGLLHEGDGMAVDGVTDLIARPLLRWSDGSVKWLGLEFRTDVPTTGEYQVPLRWGRGVDGIHVHTPDAVSRMVSENERLALGMMQVETGPHLWNTLSLVHTVVVDTPLSAVCRSEDGLYLNGLLTESVVVEHEGAHPTLMARGHLAQGDQPGCIAFEARLQESAPGMLRLVCSFTNQSSAEYRREAGAGPALGLTELKVLIPGVNVMPSHVAWPCGTLPYRQYQRLLQQGDGPNTANFTGRWTLTVADEDITSGDRTEGWVDIHSDGMGIAIGVREFAERCPRGLAVEGQDGKVTIAVEVFPLAPLEPFRWAQGTRLTVEVALCLHEGISATRRRSALASVLQPVRGIVPPEHLCDSGVFGSLIPAPVEEFTRATGVSGIRWIPRTSHTSTEHQS